MSLKILLTFFVMLVGVFTFPNDFKGIQIRNIGKEKLWVVMTGEENFVIPPGQRASVLVERGWSGRIFAKSAECQYEKCNTPYTSAELKFDVNGEDQYKVSIKDGFNRPMTIQSTNPFEYCKPVSCSANILNQCPTSHQVINSKGVLVACRSNPKLFQSLCPKAVTSDDDDLSNTFICKKSDTYLVAIG